jgi:hypothetical protein
MQGKTVIWIMKFLASSPIGKKLYRRGGAAVFKSPNLCGSRRN